jgi:hypothetical protein
MLNQTDKDHERRVLWYVITDMKGWVINMTVLGVSKSVDYHYVGMNLVFRFLENLLSARQKLLFSLFWGFRIFGLAIMVFYGLTLMRLIGAGGAISFLEAVFAGVSFNTGSIHFYNGTVACVILLMVLYGLFGALGLKSSLFLCDLAAIYTLIYQSLHIIQFNTLLSPVYLLFLIWILHRLLWGSIFLYRKNTIRITAGFGTNIAPVQTKKTEVTDD